MIDYLFFKFYRLWKYSSIAELAVLAAFELAVLAALSFLAVFLNCNIHTIWGVFEGYGLLPHPTEMMYYSSLVVIFILLCIRFCWRKRYKAVIDEYNEKPNKNNVVIILLYIFLSLFLYVLMSFYVKGKI